MSSGWPQVSLRSVCCEKNFRISRKKSKDVKRTSGKHGLHSTSCYVYHIHYESLWVATDATIPVMCSWIREASSAPKHGPLKCCHENDHLIWTCLLLLAECSLHCFNTYILGHACCIVLLYSHILSPFSVFCTALHLGVFETGTTIEVCNLISVVPQHCVQGEHTTLACSKRWCHRDKVRIRKS